MNADIRKPPDSPDGDPERWRQEWKAYIEGSWENVGQETRKAFKEPDLRVTEPLPREKPVGHGEENHDGVDLKAHRNEESCEVEGELARLVSKGPRIMVCIDYRLRRTHHGIKDYLYWREEETGLVLPQYFCHYEKYPVGSKAVRNFIVVLGERPKRLNRISLRQMVGLRAKVFVDTVRPTYNSGALKGEHMPENMSYSKVSEILEPLGYVDRATLK